MLQQAGAALPLTAKEQQTLLAAWEESAEEQEELPKYDKMPIEISENYAHLTREHGLNGLLNEQTAHSLIPLAFIHHPL